ncbi:MAG: hypothetical protein IKF19_00270 [Bacilli bacterium]|nr:hypothetical protein [Bacilli bacterium]
MKKIFKILIAIYIIVAIITTISLFTYNQYNVSQIGNKVLLKLDKEVSNYKKGNLLIINSKDNYVAGENVFYCEIENKKCNINYGNIITVMGGDPTINNESISKKLILGTDTNIKVIPFLGSIMYIFESRWIYLFFIVLPVLVAFIYEAYTISKEVKKKK